MITEKHRLFYINDKLEFALFYDKSLVDKDKIKNSFLNGKDWKDYERYNKVTSITSFNISDDLKVVNIKVRKSPK
jgi:hypothetical protein